MPLNFRDRLHDFNASDAGNYEGALVFGPEDYDEPALIRATLKSGPPKYIRGGGVIAAAPLPGCLGSLRCNITMVTNWTFPFFSELKIDDDCDQMLHVPHCDIKMVPFDVAVLYRPRANDLAVTFFVRSCSSDEIEANIPIGKEIYSADTFAAQPQSVVYSSQSSK